MSPKPSASGNSIRTRREGCSLCGRARNGRQASRGIIGIGDCSSGSRGQAFSGSACWSVITHGHRDGLADIDRWVKTKVPPVALLIASVPACHWSAEAAETIGIGNSGGNRREGFTLCGRARNGRQASRGIIGIGHCIGGSRGQGFRVIAAIGIADGYRDGLADLCLCQLQARIGGTANINRIRLPLIAEAAETIWHRLISSVTAVRVSPCVGVPRDGR